MYSSIEWRAAMNFRWAFLLIACLGSLAFGGCTSQDRDIAKALADIAPAGSASPSIKTVYFVFGSARLPPEARHVIRVVAAEAMAEDLTIQVTGYADTVGSPGSNERLSQRRALAVAAALVQSGVPRDRITVNWIGEQSPLVPTSDETPEATNRAVTIEAL